MRGNCGIQIVFDYSNGILNAGRIGRVIRLDKC